MERTQGYPSLLYIGPDAAAAQRACRESVDCELAVTGLDPTESDGADDTPGGNADSDDSTVDADSPVARVSTALSTGQYDSVACHSTGTFDAKAVVARAREYAASLPVVVFAADDAFDADAAAAFGVTSYLQVDDGFDPAATLAQVAPLVERQRAQRRDLTILDSLLEQLPLSIYVKDRAGRHVRVSDTMPTLTDPGYIESPDGKRHHVPEDVIGKTDFDLYPNDLAVDTTDDDRRVIESGESIDDQVEHAYGDRLEGTYVTTSKGPWYDEHGDITGLVGVTRNITERKQYEAQLERQNERLERFAGVISHDLRNPLEAAMGRLEFARTDGDEEHFDIVEQSLHRIDALIDDVLTLAREGEVVDDPTPTELSTVARDAWTVVDTGQATLDVETDATVLADPSRLQQLLENVFRNSIRHAGPDVVVTVGALTEREGFFVADDGPGIDPDDRSDVFDPGYSTGDEGTGLGLSIVRTIAEAHGWDVSITDADSDAGTGARFEFETLRIYED